MQCYNEYTSLMCVCFYRVNLPIVILPVRDITSGQMGGKFTPSYSLCHCLLSSYTGQVVDGLRNGWGSYKCADSNVVYTGEWKDGKRHGRVTIIYQNFVFYLQHLG